MCMGVICTSHNAARRSIALEAWAGTTGNGGRVARLGAAMVFGPVAIAGKGLRCLIQLVEVLSRRRVPLHARCADQVLPLGLV
jgi:hypothetical protein